MRKETRIPVFVAILTVAAMVFFVAAYQPFDWSNNRQERGGVMLILRGIANSKNPRGQLDDKSALEYARRLGFRGEVLDVAGDTGADSPQVHMALERIRQDQRVRAIYGFSGGGYNARHIWSKMDHAERKRIRKIVVIGSPGVAKADFSGSSEVVVQQDPPAGHMAGPKALLESLGRS